MNTLRNLCVVALVAGLALPAGAVDIPGGKKAATDCFEQFNVEGVAVTPGVATCEDGAACDKDGAQDGTCTFSVSLCVNQATAGCTLPTGGVSTPKIKGAAKKAGLQPPPSLSTAACGTPVNILVKLKKKGKKPGKAKLKALVASAASKKLKDKDVVTLVCNVPSGTAVCPSTSDAPPPPATCAANTAAIECDPNPDGGPDEIILTTADEGTDLDNGWTGVAHNFLVDPRASLKLCLSGCNATTNPVCTGTGPTGAGSINGEVFGPPLPLIASLVPVCVINNYQPGPVTATYNVQTGEVAADTPLAVNLFADTYFTSPDSVCPQCTGPNATTYGGQGTCNSGKNQGQACTVESILDVVQPGNTTTYKLAGVCLPNPGDFAGRLNIKLPLTTATSSLKGPTPCQREPGGPAGVTVKDDSCGGSACSAACGGNACVRQTSDGKCIDSKGGISQVCCQSNSATPCFPTGSGTGAICRTGRPDAPKSANGQTWPDTTYPKFGCGGTLVATFCEGATATSTINGSTGLPGPGALILPGNQTLLKR